MGAEKHKRPQTSLSNLHIVSPLSRMEWLNGFGSSWCSTFMCTSSRLQACEFSKCQSDSVLKPKGFLPKVCFSESTLLESTPVGIHPSLHSNRPCPCSL